MSTKSKMVVHTLSNIAVGDILNAPNHKEALSVLWGMPDFIPTLIKNKIKTDAFEKIVYSFNSFILREVWGCPEMYIKEYADKSNLNSLLDEIIYGDPIDIMNVPIPLLQLLDKRDQKICNRKKYIKHFTF